MLPRRLTRPLRSLLVQLHPYVSCCASCGEIKVPLEGRLCTSLAPAFPVDGLLAGAPPQEAEAARRAMSWLRRVHGAALLPAASGHDSGPMKTLAAFTAMAQYPELAEHFFIAFQDSGLGRIGMILDLFTPNGIPLLRAEAVDALPKAEEEWCGFLEERGLVSGRAASFVSDIFPSTKECLKAFVPLYSDFLAKDGAGEVERNGEQRTDRDVYAALARWSFASGMAVPAGLLHPLSSPAVA